MSNKHQLPALPYSYDALEPHYDEATVRIHHDIHHQGYVDGLNKAEDRLAEAREKNDYALVKHWEKELAFHGSGHILHSLFWLGMKPQGGGEPGGKLKQQIEKDFGGFAAFKAQFTAAAVGVEGSGWGLLVWSPMFKQLQVMQAEKHQNLAQWGVVPLLVCDVWEHAYYLKYQNKRAAFVEAWWNLVNWEWVERNFDSAA